MQIKRVINDASRKRIDAEYWNGLWNLLITQGDNNVEGILKCVEGCNGLQEEVENFKADNAAEHLEIKESITALSLREDERENANEQDHERYENHLIDSTKHLTSAERTSWNAKAEVEDISTRVSEHNTNTMSHNDIRLLIEGLTTRLNTLADSDDTTLDQMSEVVAYIKNNKSLIDGITTSKINVSDIIDNLTTNVSNKPLSAAQGVALKSLVDALSDSKVNVSDIINNLTTNVENKPLSAAMGVILKGLIDAIPDWAKQPTKPAYTYDEVGADKAGTAVATVDAHNKSETAHKDIRAVIGQINAGLSGVPDYVLSAIDVHDTLNSSHNDIRLLIKGLRDRLDAVANSTDTDLDQLAELVAYIKANRELIEEVTTKKVNVSDIINNLTSNVEDKPLSAAMGVELRNMIAQRTPTKLSDLEDDSGHRTVTDDEKIRWNSKSDFSGSYEDLYDKPYGETWLSTGSDTVVSDDVIYDAYYKVSDATPSLADVQNGCEITYYRVSDGAITGDPIVVTNSTPEFGVISNENGLLVNLDGGTLVIVSYTGIGVWGSFTFPDITAPGTYFRQVDYACTHSFKLTGYNGFPMKVTRKISEEWLPNDIGAVKTVNNIEPDENGNINVKVSGEGSGVTSWNELEDRPFCDIEVPSDTLTWDGLTYGKVFVTNDGTINRTWFAKVSDVVPTLADFQNGLSIGTYGEGEEYVQEYTGDSVVEDGNLLIGSGGGYFIVAKEDNSQYIDGEYDILAGGYEIDCTFPEKGIYFAYFADEGYVSKLTINGYTGFSDTVVQQMPFRFLPDHSHDWYGVLTQGGDTAISDGLIHGGYIKVSDFAPTEEEVRRGGTIRHYNPDDDGNLGDLITADYLSDDYQILSGNGHISIGWGLSLLVVVSFDGNPKVGAFTISAIDSPGVYFSQSEYGCMHSLTVDGCDKLSMNLEKIPAELLPEDYIKQLAIEVAGGSSSGLTVNDDGNGNIIIGG